MAARDQLRAAIQEKITGNILYTIVILSQSHKLYNSRLKKGRDAVSIVILTFICQLENGFRGDGYNFELSRDGTILL